MVPKPSTKSSPVFNAPIINWRGQSGRYYALTEEVLENFALTGTDLYVIAHGTRAKWIGAARDIIEDQASRARFRTALKTATSVLRFSGPENDAERLRAIWDIEAGQMAGALSLVGAD